jgi:hypothetical protein
VKVVKNIFHVWRSSPAPIVSRWEIYFDSLSFVVGINAVACGNGSLSYFLRAGPFSVCYNAGSLER